MVMPVDLSIVIVTWNVRDLLRRCLASLPANPSWSQEVVVVDCASSDGSAAMVAAEFPGATLLRSEENLGFSRGNNRALRQARGRYWLLLNPDAELAGDAAVALIAFLEARPRAAVAGPKLLNADGSTQSSRRRFPTLATALLESTVLQRLAGNSTTLRRYYCADRDENAVQEVDWLSGACLLVRAQAAAEVGLLDERFFMYSEELDWCRRFKAAGWEVWYEPAARVVHHGGGSSDQVVAGRHIHFNRSKIAYFRKHHGRVAALFLHAFLLATFVYQLLEEGAKWLLGHKRPLRRRRVGVYLRVLASGL
jgi:GT2 family glycosyltransferase